MALVTVLELRDYYVDIELDTNQAKGAQLILDGLQSELEAYLGRPAERRTFVETYQVGAGTPSWPVGTEYMIETSSSLFQTPITIYLKQTPIHSVESVTVLGQGSDEEDRETLTEGDDFTVLPYGVEVTAASPYDAITITYEAGLDGTQIPALKTLMLRAATREMQNMYDDTMGVKDLNTRNVGPLETGFTELELKSVRRWRRIRIA